jgi:MFS family permease
LTDAQLAFFSSSYFVGIVIGNLSCAFFADKFGRKLCIDFFMLLQFVTILLTAIV